MKLVSIISSDPSFMQVHCVQSEAGKLVFAYSTNGSSPQGNHSGHFLITVESDKKRQILVPFIAYIE